MVAVALVVLGAVSAAANDRAAITDHHEAVALARELDLGTVSLISPDPNISITAADFGSFRFRYKAGVTPVEIGGSLRLSMRHVFHWSPPQTTDPAGAGYVTVTGPDHVTLEIIPWTGHPDAHDLFLEMFPWQHAIEIKVVKGTLDAGDEVELVYGDDSEGGPGAHIQPTQEATYLFRTYVRSSSDAPLLPLPEDVSVEIRGGSLDRLRIVARQATDPGVVRLTLSAEDRFGNQSPDYSGPVELLDDRGALLRSVSFDQTDGGLKTIEVASPQRQDAFRFQIRDGARSAFSNPLRNSHTAEGLQIFFGDLHGHSFDSDGHGRPQDFYRYCRDAAALDFCALTDHDFMMTDEIWLENGKTTDRFNQNGEFVTFRAYEWSGMTDVGGDHNVFFRSDISPLFRSRSYYDYRNLQAYHGSEPQVNFIEDLYNALLQKLSSDDVMMIPHWGGRPANPNWHNGRIEKNIEIFSDHKRSHDWAYSFLNMGYRLGIIASGDNHTGRPGYGFLKNPFAQAEPIEIGTALVAVIAKELSRDSIFDALISRRTYATSGDRILLDVSMGSEFMGGKGSSARVTPLEYSVEGTDEIDRIEIMRNSAVVDVIPGTGLAASGRWIDEAPLHKGKMAAYWVRIVQGNGEEAISSPIWWTIE